MVHRGFSGAEDGFQYTSLLSNQGQLSTSSVDAMLARKVARIDPAPREDGSPLV